MQEKEIVNDVLSMLKSGLGNYARMIGETSNQQLRQTLQQIRNSDEQFQYQLANIAIQKGYYQPAQPASPTDLQQVKSQVGQ
ncbi:coat protein F [Vulcanibacillus modesticaldus]|uniref:Coat protein F n=1 Tax=Vulcanibacillus modesticaldus TaxID=337097 RepID=A0A1D2YUB1_9BACI|nr:spore coat protein [Vulcanibacillus modesticaldus]OEF99253.1 coat protein F [Vulcanibacillus modesticaldus]